MQTIPSPLHATALLIALATGASGLDAQSVSPLDRTLLEGNAATVYPLGRAQARVQTLHRDLDPSLTEISGHAYRRDAHGLRGAVPGFRVEMSLRLSWTDRDPAQPSRVFDENLGDSSIEVLPRRWVDFPGTDRPSSDPSPSFDLRIPYTTPVAVPPDQRTLCVDMRIWGNEVDGVLNRNFTPGIDAQQFWTSGRNEQPGYRYGVGCFADGSSRAATAEFVVESAANGSIGIDLSARHLVPDGGSVGAVHVMFLGASPDVAAWPWNSGCTLYTPPQFQVFLPPSDLAGTIDTEVPGFEQLPPGFRFYGQLASANPSTGQVVFTEGSALNIPNLVPSSIPVSRIANGSDHLALEGSTSFTVPVIEFF